MIDNEMDYRTAYFELLDQYQKLQKKARKYRKAKKRWKNKWLRMSCRMANMTADRAENEEK